MPKGLNLKGFGRRKSSGNVLDFEPEKDSAAPPTQSSFRVIDRPDKKPISYGSDKLISRPFNSPLQALRGKSADDLGLSSNRRPAHNTSTRAHSAWPLNGARGSGGTTNSGSSGYYESSSASARHSSTSTLPSSLDQDRTVEDEELFPHPRKSATTGMYHSVGVNADEPPPPPPSFSSRAARAFSFGNKRGSPKGVEIPPVPPPHANVAPIYPVRTHSPQRERAMTTSSYASTTVPSKAEIMLSSPDFGGDDFGTMFDSLKKEPLQEPSPIGTFHRTESEPMFPPRTHSRNAFTPSPNHAKTSRDNTNSPYAWDEESSNSALSSPSIPDAGTPGPAAANGITQAFLGNSKSGYSLVPERYTSPGPADERMSPELFSGFMGDTTKGKEPAYLNRLAQLDDDDRWLKRVELQDGPTLSLTNSVSSSKPTVTRASKPSQASTGASRSGAISPSSAGDSYQDSNATTPRATRNLNTVRENSMFDSSPIGPPSRAIRPVGAHVRTESGTAKTMTKAQFNALKRQDQSSAEHSEEEDLSGDDYDDEDDLDRAKRMAHQRQKQEANMSLYRQQMKKVTGGGPTDLPSSGVSTSRPGMERNSSSAASQAGGIHLGGIGGTPPEATQRAKVSDDDDDDVPLGILQAHGFPSASRPPTRQGDNDMSQQRRTSVAGSVVNGGAGQGNLPPFARRLPADPYFGAGLVNQSTRESLALNNGASPYAMQPQMPQAPSMGHPGGLVGVIAGEERAKAARRGNPNAAAMMSGVPLPSNMNTPQMPRTMSMGNTAPSVYNPSGAPLMPPMGMMGMGQMGMPGMMAMQQQAMMDPSQQNMQQFMNMQMQLMQNMLEMQQMQKMQLGQGGAPSPQVQMPTGDYRGTNFNNQNRPMSIVSQASQNGVAPLNLGNQGRSMTMLNPPTGWGSAANPSGPRPNSAMPMIGGGYTPSVSGMSLSGGGPGPGYTPSIAPSERSNIGMPSRYRPVTQNGDTASRSQSMTSSLTLQAFQKQQTSANLPGTPFNGNQPEVPRSTIRIVDKPKGAPKSTSRPVVDDEDDGWGEEMKRKDKKKSKWYSRKTVTSSSATNERALSELYQNMD